MALGVGVYDFKTTIRNLTTNKKHGESGSKNANRGNLSVTTWTLSDNISCKVGEVLHQPWLVALALAEKFPTANFPSHNLFENSLIGSILFYSILPPSFLHIWFLCCYTVI